MMKTSFDGSQTMAEYFSAKPCAAMDKSRLKKALSFLQGLSSQKKLTDFISSQIYYQLYH